MQLIQFHKVLISFGIAFFLLFGIREIWSAKDAGGYLAGVTSLLVVIGMAYYLIWVIRRYKKM